MGFPAGLTLRGARPDDSRSVFELIERAEVHDIGEKMFDLSDVESDWASLERDIADDVLLVESEGGLVAWAQVSGERADADVRPDHRGRGIGLALVEWTERYALERSDGSGDVQIGQTLIEDLAGTRELFVDRGYEKRWDSWVLRLPSDAVMSTPEFGDGITVRPARPEDDHAAYVVVENAFNEWDDRTPRTFDQWNSATLGRTDFDRSLMLVAADGDAVVGVCFGVRYPDSGWADQIAVVPGYRGRGLGRTMLAKLFSEFRARGETNLGLNTDSRTGALDLYLDLGMVVTQTFTRWSRRL